MRANSIKKRSNAIRLLPAFLILLTCFSGCTNNKHDVDIDDIKVELKVHRFEHELNKIRPDNYEQTIAEIVRKYPKFSYYYNKDIIPEVCGYRPLSDSVARMGLMRFINHPDIQQVFRRADSLFNDDFFVDELEPLFKYYNYHFPKRVIPEVYTFIGTFSAGVSAWSDDDSTLGIGLDLFLGNDFTPYYAIPNLPQFIIRRFDRVYIPSLVANKLAEGVNVFNNQDKRLLNFMINEGKKLYFADAMLPDANDTVKIGYTGEQLEWCKENEGLIWKHLIEKKMLYSTDMKEFGRYMDEAPFTAADGVPGNSAPKMAVWTGWQIVRKYMDNNPGLSLAQLMTTADPEKILRDSGYKPH